MRETGSRQWATPEEIKARLRCRWERGDILASVFVEGMPFPLRLPIRGPSSAEIAADFAAVREWIVDWRRQTGIPCEWKVSTHRLFGANELPAAAVFSNANQVVQLLGVSEEWRRFHGVVEKTGSAFPELLPWVRRRPMDALKLSPEWEMILAVITWIRDHPHSGKFLRQIDIPGVHTKFIERQRGTISELLDLVLPLESITPNSPGVSGFSRRYGFRDKPERIRIRFLDRTCAVEPDRVGFDLTLDASAFAKLAPCVAKVFITENEINFLAFPDHPRSLVLFGSGYGWSALDGASWLHQCEVHYWGDIDSHGFAILDQLRSHFPHVQSFLMDADTFSALKALWGREADPVRRQLVRLSDQELQVLDLLRIQGNRACLRVEQEHIPFSMVQTALDLLKNSAA